MIDVTRPTELTTAAAAAVVRVTSPHVSDKR